MYVSVPNIHDYRAVGFLGNTLFDLMASYAYAKRTSQTLVLPPFEFQNLFKERFFTIKKELPAFKNQYNEPRFAFDEIPVLEDVALQGYFQSYRYFEGTDAHSVLRPNDALVNRIFESRNKEVDLKYKDLVFNNSICSIHVRAGDYRYKGQHHTNLPLEYYWEAMGILEETTHVDYYLIFSNDIQWCRENFKGPKFLFSDTKQETSQGNSFATFDLYLQSFCSHQIIANSTFSWWAAFLNNNKDKVVVSPNGDKYPWFGPLLSGHDTSDLIPKSWICL